MNDKCETCGAEVPEGYRACPGLSPCWEEVWKKDRAKESISIPPSEADRLNAILITRLAALEKELTEARRYIAQRDKELYAKNFDPEDVEALESVPKSELIEARARLAEVEEQLKGWQRGLTPHGDRCICVHCVKIDDLKNKLAEAENERSRAVNMMDDAVEQAARARDVVRHEYAVSAVNDDPVVLRAQRDEAEKDATAYAQRAARAERMLADVESALSAERARTSPHLGFCNASRAGALGCDMCICEVHNRNDCRLVEAQAAAMSRALSLVLLHCGVPSSTDSSIIGTIRRAAEKGMTADAGRTLLREVEALRQLPDAMGEVARAIRRAERTQTFPWMCGRDPEMAPRPVPACWMNSWATILESRLANLAEVRGKKEGAGG